MTSTKLITRSKINHDSLWVKILTSDKSEVKLFIGRSGVRITRKSTPVNAELMRTIGENMTTMFQDLYKSGSSYGEIINKIEAAYK
ncbi:hypothetical protein MYOV011v1_p0406 [Vibrio phage 6E35.1a]|nr:hypothetical protein MYOV011v1_p0406 [Vibrio phage 6E35.1a]